MLKRFLMSMLGTIAGFWISIVLFFFFSLFLIGSIAGSSEGTKVRKHSVLVLDLEGTVAERFQPQSLMQAIQQNGTTAPSLAEMRAALRLAADDSKIDALVLKCGAAGMGFATAEELRIAIEQFKTTSGKPVYAYADTYHQGTYLLASTADSLFLNPIGAIDIHGVGSASMFFSRTLDKLGVKMQIVKVGSFKSAVEPFIQDHMSAPARLQMQQYCDSLWAYTSSAIAAGRELPQDSIRVWASQMMMTWPADSLVGKGLADRLVYARNFDDMLRTLTERKSDQDILAVTPAEYLASSQAINDLMGSTKKHVAVYYAVGDITDNEGEGIVGSKVVPDIIDLADDDKVAGLVLRVNSGGGSAFASEQIWEALEYFKSKGKPFYVSMGDYAASGGYYISCGADKIYADATTLTGSIGVFGMIPDFSGLVTDKLGIVLDTVQTNANAIGITPFQPMNDYQKAAMQRSVEDVYDTFTGRVAAGRDMSVDSVKAIAEGRVWVGSKAIQLGLVDKLGGLTETLADICSELDLETGAVMAYPNDEEEMLVRMLRESGGLKSLTGGETMQLDAQTAEYISTIRRLRTMNPVQARMPQIVIY